MKKEIFTENLRLSQVSMIKSKQHQVCQAMTRLLVLHQRHQGQMRRERAQSIIFCLADIYNCSVSKRLLSAFLFAVVVFCF